MNHKFEEVKFKVRNVDVENRKNNQNRQEFLRGENFQNKNGRKKLEGPEEELFQSMKEAARRRSDDPIPSEYDWARDIWALNLPDAETKALLALRQRVMGLKVAGEATKTTSRTLEKAAQQISKGKITDLHELLLAFSYKEITLQDQKNLYQILQMKGPKDKPIGKTAMKLFSYLSNESSEDLEVYREALEDILEDYQDEVAQGAISKKKVTVLELCREGLKRVMMDRESRKYHEILWTYFQSDEKPRRLV